MSPDPKECIGRGVLGAIMRRNCEAASIVAVQSIPMRITFASAATLLAVIAAPLAYSQTGAPPPVGGDQPETSRPDNDARAAAYQQGFADRLRWEAWISSQSGHNYGARSLFGRPIECLGVDGRLGAQTARQGQLVLGNVQDTDMQPMALAYWIAT